MRLALADVPKRFSRREVPVGVTPRLLRAHESREGLAALIGLYESSLGLTRASFPDDRPAQIVGDIRLARCLAACLMDWYIWAATPWPEPATPDEVAALARAGIENPGALRLALYDYVNTVHGGFVTASERDAALDALAASLGVARATLDALLAQDDPRTAILTRASDAPPSPLALAARYNQRAVETLLMNAVDVTWRIEPTEGARLGEIVKRVCFLARRMGVNYEVSLDADKQEPELLVAERTGSYAAPTRLERARLPVLITLSGPREMVGPATQYGDRLARLCRALLGYRRALPPEAALGEIEALTGFATLQLHGRPCQFTLDERVARLLRLDEREHDMDAGDAPESAPTFDSSLEARLHADFAALERAGETAGWRLEREPEPLLLDETILVPDFALTRDQRRVYLEIAGYWRPDYRARKARKLAALRGAVALLVAAPEAARAEFAGLDASYPFIWYRGDAISAPAIIAAIQRAYDDFPARLASLDAPALLAEVARRGAMPPIEATAALRTYTRAELAQAVAALAAAAAAQDASAPEWLEGIGLCSAPYLDQLATRMSTALAEAGGRAPLAALAEQMSAGQIEMSETAIEALALRARLRVERRSLFAAEVVAFGATAAHAPLDAAESSERAGREERLGTQDRVIKPQPRSAARRKPSGARWSARDLFEESPTPGADASE